MFDEKEFGKRLQNIRKSRGYSLENMLTIYDVKNISSVSRFEKGESQLTIKQAKRFCDEFKITLNDLFDDNIEMITKKKYENPFNVNTLYVYYKGYLPNYKKYKLLSFRIKIEEKEDYTLVTYNDGEEDITYSIGYLNRNDTIAIFDFRNYEPNITKLHMGTIVVGISNNPDGIYHGCLFATNNDFIPTIKKCIITKSPIDLTEELEKSLEYTSDEIEALKKNYSLNTNIFLNDIYEK